VVFIVVSLLSSSSLVVMVEFLIKHGPCSSLTVEIVFKVESPLFSLIFLQKTIAPSRTSICSSQTTFIGFILSLREDISGIFDTHSY
jgi:hypothetical protein